MNNKIDIYEYYNKRADSIRIEMNRKDYFEKIQQTKYSHIENIEIIKLLVIKEYYIHTCFSPKEEDILFYKSFQIDYKWLIWNINWIDIENDIKKLFFYIKEENLKIIINNIFSYMFMYFDTMIFIEVIKYLEIEGNKSKKLISINTIKEEIILTEKRLNERNKNKSKIKSTLFEELYTELKDLYEIYNKYCISNFKSLKSNFKKILSDDIDKYYLYPIIKILTSNTQEKYPSIYSIIRKIIPHRNKYNQRDIKYWFKDESEFLNYRHYKGIEYYDWQEYCKLKIKNFIKNVK